ncbi:MAG: hypothetical protein ACLVGQ_09700 [Blautia massiliensis (ex Durand et al. 2017)]|uniref:hypothetical protein n=1 Tax=Blautia massiliensis (ex Durand et al. 2017) TaxID=1737424 RepID=UPI00399CC5D3
MILRFCSSTKESQQEAPVLYAVMHCTSGSGGSCAGIQVWNVADRFSVGISMIIMFIVTMTELNQEMYQLISREGKIKERLEIATILNKCIAELISGEDEDAAISICCVLSVGILTEIAVILFRSMKRGMSVQIPMSMP